MIDAHVHVACADVERFPRVPGGVGSDWSASPADGGLLVQSMAGPGVEHAVVVQAVGVYDYDCRCAIETVEADAARFALVVAVDMDGADPAADLVALAGSTAVAGVRAFAVGRAGTAWLDDGRGAALWAAAGDLGLSVVATIFTDRLAALRALVEQHPGTTVALDHCAFPDMAAPERRDDLLALADLPSLHLKVTSHNLDQPGDPATFLEPLVARFGADRVAWGSDHPQHRTLDYAAMVALAERACRNLDVSERDAVLDATSRRLWFTLTA